MESKEASSAYLRNAMVYWGSGLKFLLDIAPLSFAIATALQDRAKSASLINQVLRIKINTSNPGMSHLIEF